MCMGNRKEEILIVALHLFARDGYEAVSVSQIAGELDMTKGALYRHYKSKRDIIECIVRRMEQQDGKQARENEVPQESIEKTPEEYVKDLFKNMEIKNPKENAVKFYANMFFYYSMYDGAADKAKVKSRFEHMLGIIVEEMKQ